MEKTFVGVVLVALALAFLSCGWWLWPDGFLTLPFAQWSLAVIGRFIGALAAVGFGIALLMFSGAAFISALSTFSTKQEDRTASDENAHAERQPENHLNEASGFRPLLIVVAMLIGVAIGKPVELVLTAIGFDDPIPYSVGTILFWVVFILALIVIKKRYISS